MPLPADLAAAMDAQPEARRFYNQLSYSRRRAYVTWVEDAKKADTRQRRLREAITLPRRRPRATLTAPHTAHARRPSTIDCDQTVPNDSESGTPDAVRQVTMYV